jgi:hypothetical protein
MTSSAASGSGVRPQFTLFPEESPSEKMSQLMSSSSASNLPRFNGNGSGGSGVEDQVHVRPRLSKSEENLIDLETPDGVGGGLNLENSLYDLVSNNCVFEEESKTDDQLLTEYGLNDYFAKLNIQPLLGGRRTSEHSAISLQSNPSSETSNSKWATFD